MTTRDLNPSTGARANRISVGVEGLDDILGGGLMPGHLYLVEGVPGAGKTTLALQFLIEGRDRGERGLYVTLSESNEELRAVAEAHGWSLDGIDLFELGAIGDLLGPQREMTLFHPWELELGETIKLITEQADRTGAARVVFDSLSEMRLLAVEPLRFRRQVLALKQFFVGRKSTVLLLDDLSTTAGVRDLQLHSLSHGVISMDRVTLDFGAARRRIEVTKLRGAPFWEGWHDYVIRTGGLDVFPSLVAADHQRTEAGEPLRSGIAELDALLDGGPLRGTNTLLTGPAGTGKSTLILQYLNAAAMRGEYSVLYEFDERIGTLLLRSAKLGLDLKPHIEAGLVTVHQVDPSQMPPGELVHRIRQEVEQKHARIIVIDSLNGYLSSMPQEKQLILQLHELLSYLSHRGVATFLLNPQHGLIGSVKTALDFSYLADAILLLRFFEAGGRVRKAISVIKNRGGNHEDTIREYRIGAKGIQIGAPLTGFHGVLTGTPSYVGAASPLLATGGNPDA